MEDWLQRLMTTDSGRREQLKGFEGGALRRQTKKTIKEDERKKWSTCILELLPFQLRLASKKENTSLYATSPMVPKNKNEVDKLIITNPFD